MEQRGEDEDSCDADSVVHLGVCEEELPRDGQVANVHGGEEGDVALLHTKETRLSSHLGIRP